MKVRTPIMDNEGQKYKKCKLNGKKYEGKNFEGCRMKVSPMKNVE